MAFGLPVYSYGLNLISWFETIMPLHTFIEKTKSYCLIHVFSRTAADYHVIRYFGGAMVSRTREREWAPPLLILILLPSPHSVKKHPNVFDTESRFNLIRPAAIAGSEGLGNREPILMGSLHCTGVNIYILN